MQKVLIIIGDASETLDTMYPYYRLQEAGFLPVVAAPEKRRYQMVMHEVRPGWTITKEWEGYQLQADLAFADVKAEEYAGIFFSGGRAPEYIRYDAHLVAIARYFFAANKPIASVCHGVEIPAYADCVRGRRMATVPKCRFDLEVCGGTFVDEPCVIDGNLVSGRTYHDNGRFVGEWIKLLVSARDGHRRLDGAKPRSNHLPNTTEVSMPANVNRRHFLRGSSLTLAGAAFTPYFRTARAADPAAPGSKNARIRFGAIGLRYQGSVIAREAAAYGDLVALCDVDGQVLAKAKQEFGGKATAFADYRQLLERKDIDAVLIGTPDHWHASMLLDACRAGKDVYCEKPLTLTIEEGQHVQRVVKETGRVVQVGSWQRSDSRFRMAAELVHSGRLGKIQKITVVLGKNVQGGPFATSTPPADFDWNAWQGQTPAVPYIKERSHYTFRWWYEYSGGQMTDWGAHHVDIAQWMLGANHSGPVKIETTATLPTVENGYNVASAFSVKLTYASGAVVEVLEEGRNGLLIDGELGQIFVNRGAVQGTPVEDLKDDPLDRSKYVLYAHDNRKRPDRAGKIDAIKNHMGNFVDCLTTRHAPISDVTSQHRSISTCHLANISMRLKRSLAWDPEKEQVLSDDEANRWLTRERRKGFELTA